jgi:hypothetical protein
MIRILELEERKEKKGKQRGDEYMSYNKKRITNSNKPKPEPKYKGNAHRKENKQALVTPTPRFFSFQIFLFWNNLFSCIAMSSGIPSSALSYIAKSILSGGKREAGLRNEVMRFLIHLSVSIVSFTIKQSFLSVQMEESTTSSGGAGTDDSSRPSAS